MSSAPARRAASRPPRSWRSASSPVRSQRAAARGERGPGGRGDDAVDPVGAAVGEEADRLGRLGEVGLHVADRHRRADPDGGARRAAPARGPRAPWARTGRAPRPGRRARAASAPRHDSSQAGSRSLVRISSAAASASQAGAAAAWRRRAGSAGRLVPGRVRVEHHLLARGQHRAQRLGGGRVAHPQHELRPVLGGEALRPGAARRSGRRRGCDRARRSAARRWARRGPASRPRSASRATGSASSSALGPQTIAPRGVAAMRSASRWTSLASGALECSRSSTQGRSPSRPCQSARRRAPRRSARAARAGGS